MSYGTWLLLLIFTVPAWSSPAEEPEENRIPILDSINDFVGNDINHLANDFDAFFATERADDELGRSKVRIRANYRVAERALPRDDVQFRFNLRLPYLEQRFRYEVEDKKVEKKVATKEERLEAIQRRIRRNRLDERWLFTGDTGVNVSLAPRAIVRGRLRKSKETGTLIHRFAHEVSWQTDADGFRQRTLLDTDQTISEKYLFRFSNLADWRISQQNFRTAHGPGIFQKISDHEALSYNLTMGTTVLQSVWFITNYTASVTYRRNLYKDLVYGDITPGLDFPKQWSFRRTPFIFMQLEFLFGS